MFFKLTIHLDFDVCFSSKPSAVQRDLVFIVSGRIEYGIAKHFRCSFLRLCSRVCVCVCVCVYCVKGEEDGG